MNETEYRQLGLHVVVEPRGVQFLARCPELNLRATGRTFAEAHEMLLAMIDAFITFTRDHSWEEYADEFRQGWDWEDNDDWLPPNRLIN